MNIMSTIEIVKEFAEAFKSFNKEIDLSTANIYLDESMFKNKLYGFYGWVTINNEKIAYAQCYDITNDCPIDINMYEEMANKIQEGVRQYK
jgi:hypothetical protein